MKRFVVLSTALALLLTGCTARAAAPGPVRYEASFLGLFDTVITVVGYAENEDAFRAEAQKIHDALREYHRLFDVYHAYPGLVNLKTVNDAAGGAPVKVDRRILDLLLFCREMDEQTAGRVNTAMGSVLSLWHDARERSIADPLHAAVPDKAALVSAARHTAFRTILLDAAASTVCITDAAQRLDVGAVAKGWAVEQVCAAAPAGLLVSVGGNVRATGSKPDGTAWVAGIESPDGDGYLRKVYVDGVAVVTSGDYQRYFTVNGVRCHHIIDPATLQPAAYWRAVTILCADSGVADALSTALFNLPRAEGQALLTRFGAEAMWVSRDGTLFFSPGFQNHIRT